MKSSLESRLDELESRLAFQDDLIESLNEVIAQQDQNLSKLVLQVQILKEKLVEFEKSTIISSLSSRHELPPHY